MAELWYTFERIKTGQAIKYTFDTSVFNTFSHHFIHMIFYHQSLIHLRAIQSVFEVYQKWIKTRCPILISSKVYQMLTSDIRSRLFCVSMHCLMSPCEIAGNLNVPIPYFIQTFGVISYEINAFSVSAYCIWLIVKSLTHMNKATNTYNRNTERASFCDVTKLKSRWNKVRV